jgi:threonine aldolase
VVNQPDGTLALEDVREAIRGDDAHFPPTRLITIENTHNRCGGVALTVEYTRRIGELAHQHGLRLHLDGARLFNAAVAQSVSPAELAGPADSVTFCLSKGLSAPVGSVLCGSQAFIHQAHRMRKQLGGGMRQAGILAAAGIVALETMVVRLAEDHRRARCLAEGLAGIPGLILDPGTPFTNMVFLSLAEGVADDPAGGTPAQQVTRRLAERGVRVGVVAPRRFRLVTHCWIDDEAVEQAVSTFAQVV